MTKRCARCGVEKSTDDFTPLRGGFYSYCRPCAAAIARERNQDPVRRAAGRERTRQRRLLAEKAETDRETSRRWKASNPEKVRAQSRKPETLAATAAWDRRNPDRKLAATKRYQAKNPEIGKVSQQRRRARLTGVDVTLTQAEWLQILEDFNHRCGYCLRDDLPLQQEHMQPLSKGGVHAAGNVIPACGPCNFAKHTRGLLQFLAYSGRVA